MRNDRAVQEHIAKVGVTVRRGKLYTQCGKCGKTVRIDKPLAGGKHFCVR